MIARLEKILQGELQPTDTDKRFYTHEIRGWSVIGRQGFLMELKTNRYGIMHILQR
jgi:hypothetical protein